MNGSQINMEPGFLLLLLLAVFTLAATLMASATLLNKLRLRKVRISWKAGKMRGYPIFSTLFVSFSLVLFGLSYHQGVPRLWITFLLYFWMSGGWFVTSYLASKHYITDNGIVKNINDPSQSVQWYQIRDYLEQENGRFQKFVFLYRENELHNEANFIRLELNVPKKYLHGFRKLISHKLGHQINSYDTTGFDLEQFNLK